MTKLDNKVYSLVKQKKSLKELKVLFPDAQSLVNYSNDIPAYPSRKDSVLALLVYTEDVDFMRSVIDDYFASDDDDTQDLLSDFLNGTTSTGQIIDYHYFAEDLSPKEKLKLSYFLEQDDQEKEAILFKYQNNLYPEDKRQDSQINRAKIYEYLAKLYKNCSKNSVDHLAECKSEVIYKDKKSQDEIDGGDFLLFSERKPFQTVYFCSTDNHIEAVNGVDFSSDKRASEQVFKKMRFPMDYGWSFEALDIFQQTLKNQQDKDFLNKATNFFDLSGGMLLFNQNSNDGKDGAKTFASYRYDGDNSIINIYVPNWNKNTLSNSNNSAIHELSHALDLYNAENKSISSFEVSKFIFMSAFVNKNRNKFIAATTQNYNKNQYVKEFVARVAENNDNGTDELFNSYRKLFSIYADARLENKDGVIKHIETMMPRLLPNYKEVASLYNDFENFAELSAKYNKQEDKRIFNRNTAIEVPKEEYDEKFCDFYKNLFSTLGSSGAEKLEKNLINTIAKEIHQIEKLLNPQKENKFKTVLSKLTLCR